MKFKNALIVLLITALVSLAGNFVGPKINPITALPGMLILVGIAAAGIGLAKIIPGKIPAVAYIVTLAAIMTIPGVPFSKEVYEYTSKVNFLALCTPILAYAGIYTGKNLSALKNTGWRIFILDVAVMLGTYIFSALIAHFVLKLIGQI